MNQSQSSRAETDAAATLGFDLRLPPLPLVLVYEDDYSERVHKINVDEASDSATIFDSGEAHGINFKDFEPAVRSLVRNFLLSSLLEYAPASILYFHRGLKRAGDRISTVVSSEPESLLRQWASLTLGLDAASVRALKSLLSFQCRFAIGRFDSRYSRLVSQLTEPRRDPYAVVRSGDCFISVEEEAAIVRWIDSQALNPSHLAKQQLRDACLVICSYQFGMRPKQLGVMRKRDLGVRVSPEDSSTIATLTFRTIKQHDANRMRIPLIRKVKREWAPLFARLMTELGGTSEGEYLFGYNSRRELSAGLIRTLDTILPGGGRNAYALRHSMAQRMVDAGASHEELAAALGHTYLKTGNVYFDVSANQAELVNKALGLSEVYRTATRIAIQGYISREELAYLKGDHQVAGVPHGIPLSGLGSCHTGQSSCPKNPIFSCYGCDRFLAVNDLKVHGDVLQALRTVVVDFFGAGRGETASPAFLQLQQTISDVKDVIADLETNPLEDGVEVQDELSDEDH